MSNWRTGRELYGKIRSGQLWKKRDSGMVMEVARKAGGQKWTVRYQGWGKKSHQIDERIIYHYYDKIK